MKIRGNTIGTPLKPEKNLVKATDLTPAEQAQARRNIGAADTSVYDLLPAIFTLYQNEDEHYEIDCDWSDLLDAVSTKSPVILVDSTLQNEDALSAGNYYYLSSCYIEDGYVVFMSADDVEQEYVLVYRSGTVEKTRKSPLVLDASLKSENKAAPASVVGELSNRINALEQNGFELLAETILTEDVKEIIWTKGDNGEVLDDYKDFFVYWTGKFDAAAAGEAFICRANDGGIYFCYTYIDKPTTQCGMWWHIKELYRNGKEIIWITEYPSQLITQYEKDFTYYMQGLSGANKALKSCMSYNGYGVKINRIQFSTPSNLSTKMVAGSKAMLLGRKR